MDLNEELLSLTRWLIIATFSASFIALIIALWGKWLSSIFFKPKLRFYYDHKWPDAIKIPFTTRIITNTPVPKSEISDFTWSYFLRFRIKNNGNKSAKNVEVIVNKIEKKNIDGNYHPYKPFIPLNLGWSNTRGQIYYSLIPPKIEKHCDLGFVLHPQKRQIDELIDYDEQGITTSYDDKDVIFQISFVIKPNVIESYYLLPGTYKLELIAVSSNSKIKSQKFELILEDKWLDNSDKMLAESIGLKLIK